VIFLIFEVVWLVSWGEAESLAILQRYVDVALALRKVTGTCAIMFPVAVTVEFAVRVH
jgi:hypothetical protein